MKMQPTSNQQPYEELKKELEKRGFSVEMCKGFLNVKYTPKAPRMGYTLNGLEIHFNKKLVVVNRTDTGFYVAFSL